jgi:hypothetical protein
MLDERQNIFVSDNSSSRQRGCYIRTVTARVQLNKKSLAVSLKGLDAKTNRLAVKLEP